MSSYLVVGIENRTSKKGESYHMIHLSQPFTDPKYGVGSRTSIEYISNKYYPTDLKVGDEINLVYGRSFDGKAYVSGMQVLDSVGIPTINNKK